MPRFYCPAPLAVGNAIVLPETVTRHIQVLRLAAGAPVSLFNGAGGVFHGHLAEISRREARAVMERFDDAEAELPYAITLAQAVPEGAKMDWIIEKAVELGVTTIQPLAAQRCVVRLSEEREEKKRRHWEAIVVAASEQSGRNRLAAVAPVASVSELRTRIGECGKVSGLLLTPRAQESLAAWAAREFPRDVLLAIGPEGGFTSDEEHALIESGMVAVSVGPRILRTETAGLAAAAMLNALWEARAGTGR